MDEETRSSEMDLLGSAFTGLPGPLQKTFFKAISSLLADAFAVPSAKLKQITQSIESVTSNRAAAAKHIGDAAIAQMAGDETILQAGKQIYLPSHLKKIRNSIDVAKAAATHLEFESKQADTAKVEVPDEDWLNSFMKFAENASSERAKNMFGRILSGQIVRPFSFGLATLRAVSELDQSIANDFLIAWSKSVGESVDYGNEWQQGNEFVRWRRLVEAGLMAPLETFQSLPDFIPFRSESEALWSPFNANNNFPLIYFKKHANIKWSHIDFTRVGKEIGSLLPTPNYEANMLNALLRLDKNGLSKITLTNSAGEVRLVWTELN